MFGVRIPTTSNTTAGSKDVDEEQLTDAYKDISDESLIKARETFFFNDTPLFEPVKRENIIGLDYAFAELERYIIILKKFSQLQNDQVRRDLESGVLFVGPPGCGKTYTAQYLATATEARFIDIQKFPTRTRGKLTPDDIRHLFELARKYVASEKRPVILFWDEFDAYVSGSSDETKLVVARIKSEISGAQGRTVGIFIVATTNNIFAIPSALLRRGRIGGKIEFWYPSRAAQKALLKHFAAQYGVDKLDYQSLSCLIPNATSPIDIEMMVSDAWQSALIRSLKTNGKPKVSQQDIANVLLRRLQGPPHEIQLPETAVKRQALELSASAIVARTLDVPMQLIAVATTGYFKPVIVSEAEDDSGPLELTFLEATIAVALTNMATEEVFAYATTASRTSAREQATRQAYELLEVHALRNKYRDSTDEAEKPDKLMSLIQLARLRDNNKLPAILGANDEHITKFNEIEHLLNRQLEIARAIVKDYKDVISATAEELIRRGHLTQTDIDAVLDPNYIVPEPKKPAHDHKLGFRNNP